MLLIESAVIPRVAAVHLDRAGMRFEYTIVFIRNVLVSIVVITNAALLLTTPVVI